MPDRDIRKALLLCVIMTVVLGLAYLFLSDKFLMIFLIFLAMTIIGAINT